MNEKFEGLSQQGCQNNRTEKTLNEKSYNRVISVSWLIFTESIVAVLY